jgi:hypothetical protein
LSHHNWLKFYGLPGITYGIAAAFSTASMKMALTSNNLKLGQAEREESITKGKTSPPWWLMIHSMGFYGYVLYVYSIINIHTYIDSYVSAQRKYLQMARFYRPH